VFAICGWPPAIRKKRSRIAAAYMSRVERGTGNPSLDAIEAFAVALKVPVQELFVTGKPDSPRSR
jgi:transcriptional regulator with XRE-family HTH domain